MPIEIGVVLTKYLPIFNLLLVVAVISLFIRLFTRDAKKHIYTTPWKLLFAAVLVYVVEQLLTVLRHAKLVSFIHEGNYLLINTIFETAIVTLFIYTLLLQKEHVVQKGYHKK